MMLRAFLRKTPLYAWIRRIRVAEQL